ncbi:putative quinol monooxygenase [Nocardioides caldifontis]|uniref:putative quinol monooxygenase n=1 Tax=Nocardioides caldifontis TaxID=2588938 RepID=UPI0011DF113F|nr:antibiotic biosynthesis monooxygenase family protein [Nocardioides caldifontis]
MLIVAGSLTVHPHDRDDYLVGVARVTAHAREAPGCLEFVQAPDPLEAGRIVILERWESEEDLRRFRASEGPTPVLPEVVGADVAKYVISSVEEP